MKKWGLGDGKWVPDFPSKSYVYRGNIDSARSIAAIAANSGHVSNWPLCFPLPCKGRGQGVRLGGWRQPWRREKAYRRQRTSDRNQPSLMNRRASNQEKIETLVERAREGDLDAFEALVAHYQDRVYNYVLRMIYDPMDAQDVAQETFVRAWQGLPRFRGASSFQTWLYRIASNLAIDAARSRKRRGLVTVSLEEPVEGMDTTQLEHELPDDSRYEPVQALEQEELRQYVWAAVGELSEKLRPVIVLADLQGLSYGEIAKILGCPVGTVKSRLFNARGQLRDKLKEKLPQEILSAWSAPAGSAAVGAMGVGGKL